MPKRPKPRKVHKARKQSKRRHPTRPRPPRKPARSKTVGKRAAKSRQRWAPRRRIVSTTSTRIRTLSQYFRMRAATRDRYKRVLQVVSDMRAGKSETDALRDAGVSRDIVRQFAASAFRKRRTGRLVIRPHDRLLRVLYVPDETAPDGKREIAIMDSEQATTVSNYWHVVYRYLRTGDGRALAAFRGVTVVTARGERVTLLTDLKVLRRLGNAGTLSFETIYSR